MFKLFRKSVPSTAETAAEQNIFDDETFFAGYRKLRESDTNSNDLLEQPAMRKLLPDLADKTVLDLGCGYGHNCIEFVQKGASRVVGVVKYHRPFSDIINALANAGFIIEQVVEPLPEPWAVEKLPTMAKEYIKPNFLIVKARKE